MERLLGIYRWRNTQQISFEMPRIKIKRFLNPRFLWFETVATFNYCRLLQRHFIFIITIELHKA